MNYLKLYINHYGEIQFDHNIHHFDGNRNNNDVSNLISIPIDLHKKYHSEELKMIKCFKLNNIIGFEYHRDMFISLYNKILTYKK